MKGCFHTTSFIKILHLYAATQLLKQKLQCSAKSNSCERVNIGLHPVWLLGPEARSTASACFYSSPFQ